ncbi:MAG: hypothetical protein J3T61_12540, partial [Candidatus Brocadiales bacterium]|nr:hypothetical protein [Candidatus Bathyanammoxibius sp.]
GINFPISGSLVKVGGATPIEGSRRVYIDSYLVAIGADTGGHNSGIQYSPSSDNLVDWVTGNPLSGGYGIYFNAGGWRWASKLTGVPFSEDVAITWPTGLDTWALVEIEHEMATHLQAARVRLYINKVLILTRNWEVGTGLPGYNSGEVNAAQIMRKVRSAGAASFWIGSVDMRKGQYRLDGTLA